MCPLKNLSEVSIPVHHDCPFISNIMVFIPQRKLRIFVFENWNYCHRYDQFHCGQLQTNMNSFCCESFIATTCDLQ